MDFDFSQLDLTGVDASRGRSTLRPGPHITVVRNPEIKDTSKGGRQLKVDLMDLQGAAGVTDYITLAHPKEKSDPKAALSVQIGKERLKALLIAGNHPSPDKPSSIRSLDGLIVGVNVEQGEDWTDDKGVVRKGGGKPAKSGAYFKPEMSGGGMAPMPKVAGRTDPDIPF